MCKKILFTIFVMGISMISSTRIHAAEKDVDVNIEKDYKNCTFTIDMEKPGNYIGSIICPLDNEFECSVIDDDTLVCTIEDCRKGTWIVRVKENDMDEIGKVKVSVSTATTQETNVVDNIKVGKDITGLSMYFKDDSFIAKWTDDTCGNVNISVVNLDTAEILGNEIVTDKYFECNLDKNVKKISVTVVPSSSASIEGAEMTYTYDVDNHPDAVVTFPDEPCLNTDSVSVKVKLNKAYGVYVENNNENVYEEKSLDIGEHVIDVPLPYDGTNNIKFYIVDEIGNMRSTEATIIKDTVAPKLVMDANYDKVTTSESTYLIRGHVDNCDSLAINGKEIDISTDGTFQYECVLHLGENANTITAADAAGNESTVSFSVIMQEKTKNTPKFLPIIIIATFALAIWLLRKSKAPGQKNSAVVGQPDDEDYSETQNESVSENENTLQFDAEKKSMYKKIEHEKEYRHEDVERAEEDDCGVLYGNDENNKHEEDEYCMNNESVSQPESTHENVSRKTIVFEKGKSVITVLIICIVVTLICNMFVLMGNIPTGSMEPVIMTNDLYIANRQAYVKNSPQRGDIIYFHKAEEGSAILCKRIIGMPGDVIEFADGYVYVNDKLFSEESYLNEEVETNCMKTFVVPEGCYFVLGDNRETSLDSRYWENPYVNSSEIIAKHLITIPTHRICELPRLIEVGASCFNHYCIGYDNT